MKRFKIPVILAIISLTLFYCKTNKQAVSNVVTSAEKVMDKITDFTKSPFLTPEESMQRMQIADGFEVKLIASEPLVSTPVAMVFDNNARMWVVEMTGYMPDTVGTGEEIPNGSIVILEDKNKDGIYDDRKVIIDSLVLPRAVCLIENGVLVAEPTNLWFYEIKNDKVVKRTLVDAEYTEGGNVEHQPNGLLRAMDNWIYNAKSTKRYRKQGDKWLIEQTHFRGQWGITQDNYGKLYYNNNSQNLIGDYFMPGLGAGNKNQRRVEGFNQKTVANNKVYPIRPTPGVNRGYMKNVLNDSLKLNEFTAAAGPVIYRGSAFGDDFEFDSFVPEPSANLIKRNHMAEKGYIVDGEQAYSNKEFLASTDERFRPVNLFNAPDGSIVVLDMYRGIIQHKTYLTPYLKNQIGMRELTQPLSAGRIYKILPKGKKLNNTIIAQNPADLFKQLSDANGWVRDKAQQNIIDRNLIELVPNLIAAIDQKDNELLVIHAIWTLEGLKKLSVEQAISLIKKGNNHIRTAALATIPSVINLESTKNVVATLNDLIDTKDTLSAPYVAFLCKSISNFDSKSANNLLVKLATTYPDNQYVSDAIISNLQDREDLFDKEIAARVDGKQFIRKQLNTAVVAATNARKNRNPDALKKEFPKGEVLFTSICQTCHGLDGNGVASLGPPLNQSEWVVGNKNKLISIVLYGLTGPVTVNGHVYKTPEISGDMPGIGYDQEMKSEDIAQLLSYIRKSWRNNANPISMQEVASKRKELNGRENAFTEIELKSMQ